MTEVGNSVERFDGRWKIASLVMFLVSESRNHSGFNCRIFGVLFQESPRTGEVLVSVKEHQKESAPTLSDLVGTSMKV